MHARTHAHTHTERQTDGQKYRHTDRHTNIYDKAVPYFIKYWYYISLRVEITLKLADIKYADLFQAISVLNVNYEIAKLHMNI